MFFSNSNKVVKYSYCLGHKFSEVKNTKRGKNISITVECWLCLFAIKD
jgi:hypothetical protein